MRRGTAGAARSSENERKPSEKNYRRPKEAGNQKVRNDKLRDTGRSAMGIYESTQRTRIPHERRGSSGQKGYGRLSRRNI